MPSPNYLEQEIWYRLAKVIYIALCLIALSFVARLAYKEGRQIWEDRTTILCNDGSKYQGQHSDTEARMLCAYGRPGALLAALSSDLGEDNKYPVPRAKNYDIQPTFGQEDRWTALFIKVLCMGVFMVWLVPEALKRTFLYIAVGKRIFS